MLPRTDSPIRKTSALQLQRSSSKANSSFGRNQGSNPSRRLAWTKSLELAEALEYAETVNHRNTAVTKALGRRGERRAPMTLGQRAQRALAGRSWG